MSQIPYSNIDWKSVPKIKHKGEKGTVSSKTIDYPGLRLRIVEYSDGYLADHWCRKGISFTASQANSLMNMKTEINLY